MPPCPSAASSKNMFVGAPFPPTQALPEFAHSQISPQTLPPPPPDPLLGSLKACAHRPTQLGAFRATPMHPLPRCPHLPSMSRHASRPLYLTPPAPPPPSHDSEDPPPHCLARSSPRPLKVSLAHTPKVPPRAASKSMFFLILTPQTPSHAHPAPPPPLPILQALPSCSVWRRFGVLFPRRAREVPQWAPPAGRRGREAAQEWAIEPSAQGHRRGMPQQKGSGGSARAIWRPGDAHSLRRYIEM